MKTTQRGSQSSSLLMCMVILKAYSYKVQAEYTQICHSMVGYKIPFSVWNKMGSVFLGLEALGRME